MASILKVDDLRGNTSAGNITITSEGGAATMQLQQGLAKAWINYNGQGTIAVRDSLNHSSLTDNGTGNHDTSFSASFNNANYSVATNSIAEFNHARGAYGVGVAVSGAGTAILMTTSAIRLYSNYNATSTSNGASVDHNLNLLNFMGDLA